jgi:hypothetical protein
MTTNQMPYYSFSSQREDNYAELNVYNTVIMQAFFLFVEYAICPTAANGI